MFFCRELCKLLRPHWYFDWQPTRSNCQPPGTTRSLCCEFASVCHLNIVSLVSSPNSFLNWKFNLEYYPVDEIRVVLSCERQREANWFKTTTTNFNKQQFKTPTYSFFTEWNSFQSSVFKSRKNIFMIFWATFITLQIVRGIWRESHTNKLATDWQLGNFHKNLIPDIQFTKLLLYLRYRSNL